MKKICPYCGRKGEPGVSCKGCGYVLTVNDQDWEQAENPRDGQEGFGQRREDRVREEAEQSREKTAQSREEQLRGKAAEDRRDGAASPKSGSGGFLISLFGIVLVLYGSYGLTRMFHFFPDGRPLDGIVGASLMAAVALTGSMCIRPLRLRFWKAVRWPIALGYAAAIGIPLAMLVFDLAAII